MKLLITGGHITPALAIIDRMISDKDPFLKKEDILFVGRMYSEQSRQSVSFEYQEIQRRGIRFHNLNAGRMTRSISMRSFVNLMRFPFGLVESFVLVLREKPDAVLSFGGYIALPIALAASICKTPIYTHEQTIHPGIANRIIARFARRIFVSFEETRRFFDPQKTLVTGNPLRASIYRKRPVFLPKKDVPVLYITGGSLGAHAINKLVMGVIPELTKNYIVIHQCGNVKEFHDEERLKELKQSLSPIQQSRYIIRPHLYDHEVGPVLHEADLVVSRAGANTFFELIALRKPAILIPLPYSAHGEQLRHARLFSDSGAGELFLQDRPATELLSLLQHMMQHLSTYQKAVVSLQAYPTHDATTTIVRSIFNQK